MADERNCIAKQPSVWISYEPLQFNKQRSLAHVSIIVTCTVPSNIYPSSQHRRHSRRTLWSVISCYKIDNYLSPYPRSRASPVEDRLSEYSTRRASPKALFVLFTMAVNYQVVGEAFTNHYYKTFDANRRDLMSLYVSFAYTWTIWIWSASTEVTVLHLPIHCAPKADCVTIVLTFATNFIGHSNDGASQRDQSMLTFEGSAILGANEIVKKLVVRWWLLLFRLESSC